VPRDQVSIDTRDSRPKTPACRRLPRLGERALRRGLLMAADGDLADVLAGPVHVEGLAVALDDLEGLAGADVARHVHEHVVAPAAVDLLVVLVAADRVPALALGRREAVRVGPHRDPLLLRAGAVHVVGLAVLVLDQECLALALARGEGHVVAVARAAEDVRVVAVTVDGAPGLALRRLERGVDRAGRGRVARGGRRLLRARKRRGE